MRIKGVLIGILVTTLVVLNANRVFADPPPPEVHLRLMCADEGEILLELTVSDFEIETIPHDGQTYHRLRAAGMAQTAIPGAPQVPTRGTLLGLPTTEGVSVQVLEATYETLSGYRLFPAPELEATSASWDAPPERVVETFALDPELYNSDALYPGSLVEIGQIGYLRDQAVAQVQFYPVQYRPAADELRIYDRILVRVTWDSPQAVEMEASRWASPAYEGVLQHALLNYETLERPAVEEPAIEGSGSPGEGQLAAALATDATTPTLKVGVTADGLYALTRDDITSAGLDVSDTDPRTIKIHNRGSQIPIIVQGEDDGVFDAADVVLFYGTAITDVYTTKNVYWLTQGGTTGQRMDVRDGSPAGAPVPTDFPATLHAEEDTYYWKTMLNGEGQDHYFWGGRLGPFTSGLPTSRTYTLTLSHISTRSAISATVHIRLKGYTSLDHRTRIYLNGAEIDDQEWSGQIIFDHEVTVDHSDLIDGDNTIRVEAVDTGGPVDQLLVNWIEIDYWDTYVAENDELSFRAPAAGVYQFEVWEFGFSSDDVQVFDVSDPTSVEMIVNTVVTLTYTGNMLQFQDQVEANARYLALTPARYKSPASVELDQPSSWRSTSNGADYILITHEDFYSNSLTLADHRADTGLRVATVQVEDVYDEFNHGIFNPRAIRDFLSYTYQHWLPPAPTFVVLVGDAYMDYKDTLNSGAVDFVPAQIVETDLAGQAPSDNWYVTVNGDDILPDMFIGRLSAPTVSEIANIVDKIIRYDQSPPDPSWNQNVLLVADDEPTFEMISEQVADRLPYYYTANRVYVSGYPPGDPTSDIVDYISSGSIFVNYSGHGSRHTWGEWDDNGTLKTILRHEDVYTLTNTHKLPVMTIANCNNGLFAMSVRCLAETFQRLEDRGAVAVWAPSSVGYPAGHQVLLQEFYEDIFKHDEYALGAATTAAKIATYQFYDEWDELVETFILFGDPATQLGIPTNYPYVESTTPADEASDVPIDQEIQVIFNKPLVTTTVTLGGEGTLGLPFTPTWSSENTLLAYAHPDFGHGQTLTFTISGQDRLGNPLGTGPVPATWSFTMTSDDVSPTGAIGVQGGLLTDVPVTTTLWITFTEPVRTDSVAYTIAPVIPGWLTWDASDQVATYHHWDFESGQTYTFTITAAQDVAGNPLTEPLSVTFTTRGWHPVYLPVVLKNP